MAAVRAACVDVPWTSTPNLGRQMSFHLWYWRYWWYFFGLCRTNTALLRKGSHHNLVSYGGVNMSTPRGGENSDSSAALMPAAAPMAAPLPVGAAFVAAARPTITLRMVEPGDIPQLRVLQDALFPGLQNSGGGDRALEQRIALSTNGGASHGKHKRGVLCIPCQWKDELTRFCLSEVGKRFCPPPPESQALPHQVHRLVLPQHTARRARKAGIRSAGGVGGAFFV